METPNPIDPAEFPVLNERIFFNHSAVTPLPARAAHALRDYADEAARMGSAAVGGWVERIATIRRTAAGLLGADPSEIAFAHNTTHGLMCVANSMRWRPGDNIVTAEHEFPANVYVWRNLARLGVALRTVPERPDHRFRIDDFIDRIDRRTRLLAISLVQYATGYRMPVEALAQVCRERGIRLCVDAIQAVGALPVDVAELGCDFLSADGHKWMLGPEGAGLFYVGKDRFDELTDAMTGWLGRPRFQDFADTAQPAINEARRFEEGALNVAGILALGQSLALLREVGQAAIVGLIEERTARLEAGLKALGFEIVSPRADGERSGMIAAWKKDIDPYDLVARLKRQRCDLSARRGWLRFAPHFYTPLEQIDEVLERLDKLMKASGKC